MGRRSEHTRDEIKDMALAAARRIVVKHGVDGLSTRKIAADIGYTVGSLYLVFRNLDDLVLHLDAETLDDLYVAMEEANRGCASARACLLGVAHAYIQFAHGHRARWALVFERALPAKRPPWFQEKVARMFDLVEGRLRELAPRKTSRDLALAAHALWSGVHGICVLGLTERIEAQGVVSVQALADSLVENYLDGFAGASSPRAAKKKR